jgi:hypothetical protein
MLLTTPGPIPAPPGGQGARDSTERTDEAVAKTPDELDKLRKKLLGTVTQATDLDWEEVALPGGATIEVSNPYLTDSDFWVPVTAREQWALAVKLRAYPLTRAVADQAHMSADADGGAVNYKGLGLGYDFEAFSKYLNDHTTYYNNYNMQIVSGAHKLWLLSNGPSGKNPNGMAVNYGFYTKDKSDADKDPPGKYLTGGWFVRQGRGTHHNKDYWDYSQLLQFMRNYTDAGGDEMSLRDALLKGDPAIWDEENKLRPELLPF